MAAPTFAAVSVGATDATGAWTASIVNLVPAVGDLLILQVLQDGGTANQIGLAVVGIADLAGNNDTMTRIPGDQADGSARVGSSTEARQHLWIGRVYTLTGFTIAGTNAGTEDVYVRTYKFANVSSGTTLATVIENTTGGVVTGGYGTSATAADCSVQVLGPERLALNFVAVNDDNAIAQFSGQSGGTWVEIGEYAESSGTDGAIQLQYATMTSAGTINGGTASITDIDAWGVVGFALIGLNAPTTKFGSFSANAIIKKTITGEGFSADADIVPNSVTDSLTADAIVFRPPLTISPQMRVVSDTPTESVDGEQIIFVNDEFVAISDGNIRTSPDGVTWTTITLPTYGTDLGSSICYDPVSGKYGYLASENLELYVADDPLGTWTYQTSLAAVGSASFIRVGGGKVVIGGSPAATGYLVASSLTGSFTYKENPASGAPGVIGYGNGTWVFSADDILYYTTDPSGSLSAATLPEIVLTWRSIAYGNGTWLATSGSGATSSWVTSTDDGVTWSILPTIPFLGAPGAGSAYALGQFWVTSIDGAAYSSPDLTTWTRTPSDGLWNIVSLASNGSVLRAMTGSEAKILGWSGFTADAVIAAGTTTVSGSLAVDAVVFREQSNSVVADAILAETRTGSFAADAWLVKTVSGSLTTDATVQSTISGSLAVEAIVRATTPGTFAADAIVSTTPSSTLTADAIVLRGQASAFTASAVMASTITASFTADAIIKTTVTVPVVISDTFTETTDTLLRNHIADTGQTWEHYWDLYETDEPKLTVAAATDRVYLSPPSSSTTYVIDVLVAPVTGAADLRVKSTTPIMPGLVTRAIPGPHWYELRAQPMGGPVWMIYLQRDGSTSLQADAYPELGDDGSAFWLRLLVEGSSPTTLKAKAWREGDPEPGPWLIDTTDNTTENQSASGKVGIVGLIISGGAPYDVFDDLLITSPGLTADAVIAATVAGSFAADAVITRSQTGSFSADSTVASTVASSFAADAEITAGQQTVSGSFVADAVVRREIASGRTVDAIVQRTSQPSLTTDAIVLRGQTSSFTADAVLAKPATGLLTADAVLTQSQSGTVTADAVVVRTSTASLAADAAIAAAAVGSLTADAVVLAAQSGVVIADAVVLSPQSSSFVGNAIIGSIGTGALTADAVLSSTVLGGVAGDATILATGSGTLAASAVVQAATDGSVVANAFILALAGGSFVVDAVVLAPQPGSLWADAYLISVNERTGSLTADATILGGVEGSLTADAVVSVERTGSLGADATVLASIDGSLVSDAVLLAAVAGTLTSDAVIDPVWGPWTPPESNPVSGALTADAYIVGPVFASFSADALILAIASGALTANAVVVVAQTGVLTADAVFAAPVSSLFTANASLAGSIAGTLTADAWVTSAGSGWFASDAIIAATQAAAVTGDAIVVAAQTGAVLADSVISAPASGILTADATVARPQETSLTASATLRAVVTGGLAADAVLLRGETASFTADAWLTSASGGVFTADAVIYGTVDGTFVADAIARAQASATFTGDANLVRVYAFAFTAQAVQQKTATGALTADAVIEQARTDGFTTDAVLLSAQSASLTADAWIRVEAFAFTADAVVQGLNEFDFWAAASISPRIPVAISATTGARTIAATSTAATIAATSDGATIAAATTTIEIEAATVAQTIDATWVRLHTHRTFTAAAVIA